MGPVTTVSARIESPLFCFDVFYDKAAARGDDLHHVTGKHSVHAVLAQSRGQCLIEQVRLRSREGQACQELSLSRT